MSNSPYIYSTYTKNRTHILVNTFVDIYGTYTITPSPDSDYAGGSNGILSWLLFLSSAKKKKNRQQSRIAIAFCFSPIFLSPSWLIPLLLRVGPLHLRS
jgi:hypothetical protein